MIIRQEIALRDFKFWSGGADRACNCSNEELDAIEQFLEEIEPEDGWTDGDVNNMFWFEFDTLAQHLGYEDEEDFDRKHDPNYIDDDELKGMIDEWFQKFLDKATEVESLTIFELIGTIYFNLFRFGENWYDVYEDDAEYTYKDYAHWFNTLRKQHNEDTLYTALFEDDCGKCETDGVIPSWEDFRSEMMQTKKIE